jgi:hypothetical protein
MRLCEVLDDISHNKVDVFEILMKGYYNILLNQFSYMTIFLDDNLHFSKYVT